MLMKNILNDLSTWRDRSCLWMERYTMFADWKSQNSTNVNSSQIDQ